MSVTLQMNKIRKLLCWFRFLTQFYCGSIAYSLTLPSFNEPYFIDTLYMYQEHVIKLTELPDFSQYFCESLMLSVLA